MLSKFIRYLLLFVICLSVHDTNATKPLHFRYLTIDEGLSNSSVLSIMQDSKGFIWLGTRDGLNRYDGKRVTVYKDFYNKNPKGANVKINCIVEDELLNLWIGTNNGLYHYNAKKDVFTLVITNYINVIFKDNNNRIWVGTTEGCYLLRNIDPTNVKLSYLSYPGKYNIAFSNVQAIIQYNKNHLVLGTISGMLRLCVSESGIINIARENTLNDINIITLSKDSTGNIWAGSNNNGAYKIDALFKVVQNYTSAKNPNGILDNNVRIITTDSKGNVWIGTLKGLNRYQPSTDYIDAWTHDQALHGSLNYNSIYDIYEDRQGSIWIGTYYGGVNIHEAQETAFSVYQNEISNNSLGSNIISAIASDLNGRLWVGTEAEGLNLIDFNKNSIKRFNIDNKKLQKSNLVKTVFRDHNHILWAGFFNGGISYLKNENYSFTELTDESRRLNSNNITAIAEDEKQQLWVGHQDYGINIISKNRKNIFKIEEIYPHSKPGDLGITFLYKDSKNNMLIGTRSAAYIFENNTANDKRQIRKIYPLDGQKTYINCIVEDSLKRIWLGTSSGLVQWKSTGETPLIYTVKNGLSSDKVVGIVPDNNDCLWLSTNKGLSKFILPDNQFINYNRYDGLPSNVFNYHSFYKHPDGHIFFGSINGLVKFLPSEIGLNLHEPTIALTKLTINGKKIKPDDDTGILSESISNENKILLHHNQSDIEIDYAVLNFIKPEKNASVYKLEGFNNDWIYTDDFRAVFTRLQPGNYNLYIKASNNDGIWNTPTEILKIKVLPPFWKTWWAYSLYILLLLSIIALVFRFYNSRQALRRELQYEHQLNLQQQELQKMKSDFFTYMSHELRTPLTLISGPAEMLIDNTEEGTVEKKLAESIKSNSDRMMNLTNNLMNFIKADSGALKLNFITENIVLFSKNIFEKFQLAAKQKQLNYQFTANIHATDVQYDKHYMEIILTNLLSNAIKFVPVAGTVTMIVNDDGSKVEVSVYDNGAGIPAEAADKVFSEFFQASPETQKHRGTGIGLALTKKLVELHNGSITFSSTTDTIKNNNQTCFKVYLKKAN